MIMRRFHPWKEDLNMFVLRLEESGIFEAWGTKPLLADVSINPELTKHTQKNIEGKLELSMFIPFFTFLGIGCSVSLSMFIIETLGEIFQAKEKMLKNTSKCSYYIAIFAFGIVLILLPIGHFYIFNAFKPVLSFLRMVERNDNYIALIEVVGMDLEGRTEIRGTIALFRLV